jgi:hypothetical protein
MIGHCSGIDMCLPNKKSIPEITNDRGIQMDKCVEHQKKGSKLTWCGLINRQVSIERTVE